VPRLLDARPRVRRQDIGTEDVRALRAAVGALRGAPQGGRTGVHLADTPLQPVERGYM